MKTVGWWLPKTERVRRLETGLLVKKKKCKLLSVTRRMKSEILICNMVTS